MRPGRKPKPYGFEEMEVGDWLNISAEDRHRYACALSRYRDSSERMYVCRTIAPGVYRIMRLY